MNISELINQEGLIKLEKYREKLFNEIRKDYFKSSCGDIDIYLPGVTRSLDMDDLMSLHVRCYRFGETRSHYYHGSTLSELVDKAELALAAWIAAWIADDLSDM